MSTLLTAVLTHHLHWVVTVCPPPRSGSGGLQPPPLPARTLVVGRRTELVARLLLVLSYFIRDQLVSGERGTVGRGDGECVEECWGVSCFKTVKSPPPFSGLRATPDWMATPVRHSLGGNLASCACLM